MPFPPTDEHLAYLVRELRFLSAASIAEADDAPDSEVWDLCARGSLESDAADAIEAFLATRHQGTPSTAFHQSDGAAVRIRFG